ALGERDLNRAITEWEQETFLDDLDIVIASECGLMNPINNVGDGGVPRAVKFEPNTERRKHQALDRHGRISIHIAFSRKQHQIVTMVSTQRAAKRRQIGVGRRWKRAVIVRRINGASSTRFSRLLVDRCSALRFHTKTRVPEFCSGAVSN